MRLRSAFGLAAILAVILSTSALAATEKAKFNGGVSFYNPCNDVLVETTGQVLLEVAQLPDGSYRITFQYKGAGADANGAPYKVELNGRQTVTSLEAPIDIAYEGRFVAKPGAPSFDVNGDVRIYVNGSGVPTGAIIQNWNLTCAAS